MTPLPRHSLVFPLAISLVTALLTPSSASAKAGALSGHGTAAEPFLIEDYSDLEAIDDSGLAKTYRLTADIDASASAHENSDSGFLPIGKEKTPFSGTFHGSGHAIRNLSITRDSATEVALFGQTSDSSWIDSVQMINASITGKYHVGALIGTNYGRVRACSSTGSMNGGGDIGGLFGSNVGNVANSSSSATVVSRGFAGGLAGRHARDTLLDCHATGTVTGVNNVGGLVGFCSGTAVVRLCSSAGAVKGTSNVGGLIGECYLKPVVERSFAAGSVTATTSYAGGLVGYIDYYGSIVDCYATGRAQGGGGIVGYNDEGSVARCYSTSTASRGIVGSNKAGSYSFYHWDVQFGGSFSGISSPTISSTTGALDSKAMTHAASFVGWSFSDTSAWTIDEGVSPPTLRGMGAMPALPVGAAHSRVLQASAARIAIQPRGLAYVLPRPGTVALSFYGLDGTRLGHRILGFRQQGEHLAAQDGIRREAGVSLVALELDGRTLAVAKSLPEQVAAGH